MVTAEKPSVEGWTRFAQALDSKLFDQVYHLSAPAKLNLRLVVEGRRGDGYHLLSMFNVTTTLSDSLSLSLTRSPGHNVELAPHQRVDIAVSDNLVTKAFVEFWRALGCQEPPLGFKALIKKRIPIGGGLGGGSSDAGAMLRFLAEHLRAPVCEHRGISADYFELSVMTAALKVGADVPYAYQGGVAWVSGIGEVVKPLSVAPVWSSDVLITVPPDPVPTALFYRYFREQHPLLPETIDEDMRSLASAQAGVFSLALLRNDFEADVCELVPSVGTALSLARRYFSDSTSLTGSGSAIFSLVAAGDDEQASRYQEAAQREGMTVHRVRIG